MKNSVNGKSFDEIFGQRGAEIEVDKMEHHKVYLNDSTLTEAQDCYIFAFACFSKTERNFIYDSGFLSINGLYQYNNSIPFSYVLEDLFYEATPDQIALLESYQP